MGVHISFVRSLKMDRWKAHELKQMELGGNKAAKAFYEKNGMLPQGSPPDHKNPALARYKNDLKLRAAKAIGADQPVAAPTQPAPTAATSLGALGTMSAPASIQLVTKKSEQNIPEAKPVVVEKPVQEVKKPRAFVEETDIFDFSGLKKVNEKAGETAESSLVVNKISTGASSKKMETGVPDYQLGNLFQGKSVQLGSQNSNLNAKKLDINFDADDFFNSFEPMNTAPQTQKVEIKQEQPTSQTQNKFDTGSWSFDNKKETSQPLELNDEQPKPKVTTSSQGANLEDDVQARYDQLVKSGATAISSDMLFGREEQPKQPSSQGGRWSQPQVAQSLQAMGEKTQEMIGNVMSRSSLGSKYTSNTLLSFCYKI